MKKSFLKPGLITAILITLTTIVNAQWSRNSGTGVTYLTTGTDKVGIGTTAPSYKLDIKDAANTSFRIQSTSSGSSNLILARSSASGTNCLVNYKTGTTDIWFTGVAGNNTDFKIKDENYNDVFAISQSTKNFGIGIGFTGAKTTFADQSMSGIASNPSVQIGATNTYNLALDNNEVQARYNGSGNTLYLNFWAGDVDIAYSGGSTVVHGPAYLYGSTNIYNNAYVSGYLGIGTATSPSYSLHVVTPDYTAALLTSSYNGGTAFQVYGTGTGNTWAVYASAPTTGYAGYFAGNVYCSGVYSGSDEKLKENIQPLENALDKVMKLDVKTYNFKQGLDKMNFPTERQYGFIAQNLETVFPELVRVNPAKKEQPVEFKAVNYIGMIPVLTEAMQEQNKTIDNLKSENQQLKNRLDQMEVAMQSCCSNYVPKSGSAVETEKAGLGQNQPNPFNQKTVINYYLPSDANSGVINITSAMGQVVRTFVISAAGAGQVEINANTLSSGNYTYQLVVDGKAIDSKQMVITK